MVEAPQVDVCAKCGATIYIYVSRRSGNEYACNTRDHTSDFHEHRDFKRLDTPAKLPNSNREPLPPPEITTDEEDYEFSQTFKITELSASVSRKCSSATLPLPQYENIEFYASTIAEIELGADVQQIMKKLFAEVKRGITDQIAEAKRELSK